MLRSIEKLNSTNIALDTKNTYKALSNKNVEVYVPV